MLAGRIPYVDGSEGEPRARIREQHSVDGPLTSGFISYSMSHDPDFQAEVARRRRELELQRRGLGRRRSRSTRSCPCVAAADGGPLGVPRRRRRGDDLAARPPMAVALASTSHLLPHSRSPGQAQSGYATQPLQPCARPKTSSPRSPPIRGRARAQASFRPRGPNLSRTALRCGCSTATSRTQCSSSSPCRSPRFCSKSSS